jgi:hypothetical protein
MVTQIGLPFNPGQMEFLGQQPGIGGLQQLIGALSSAAAPAYGNWQLGTNANDSAQNISVATLLGGFYRRSGMTAPRTDTLPTATATAQGIPYCQIGTTFPFIIANPSGQTLTLAAADANTTLAGTTTVLTVAIRVYLVTMTLVPVNIIGLSYANGVVTVTTNLPHGLAAGGTAVIANTGNSGFEGSKTIATVPNSYQLTYALTTATAFATSAVIPNLTAQAPGLLNTTATNTVTGCFAWDKTTGSYA